MSAHDVVFLLPGAVLRFSSKLALRDGRRQAIAVVLGQLAIGCAIAAACLGIWGVRAAGSALLGAAIGVAATALMAFALLRHGPDTSAMRLASSLLTGWLVKVGFTLALLVVAFRSPQVDAMPLLGAYIATFLGYWLGAARGDKPMIKPTVGVAD